MSNEESIISKIKKLIDKQTSLLQVAEQRRKDGDESGAVQSLAEAESFMMKAQQMLQDYNIEFSKIEMSDTDKRKRISENQISFTENYERSLIHYVAMYNFVRSIGLGSNSVALVGRPENIDIVEYLYTFFRRTILNLSVNAYQDYLKAKEKQFTDNGIEFDKKEFKKSFANNFMRDYTLGAVMGVAAKMKEQKENAEKSSEVLTSLILTNDKEIAIYIEERFGRLVKGKGLTLSGKGDGYNRGFADGKNISARSGVKGGGSSKMLS